MRLWLRVGRRLGFPLGWKSPCDSGIPSASEGCKIGLVETPGLKAARGVQHEHHF